MFLCFTLPTQQVIAFNLCFHFGLAAHLLHLVWNSPSLVEGNGGIEGEMMTFG